MGSSGVVVVGGLLAVGLAGAAATGSVRLTQEDFVFESPQGWRVLSPDEEPSEHVSPVMLEKAASGAYALVAVDGRGGWLGGRFIEGRASFDEAGVAKVAQHLLSLASENGFVVEVANKSVITVAGVPAGRIVLAGIAQDGRLGVTQAVFYVPGRSKTFQLFFTAPADRFAAAITAIDASVASVQGAVQHRDERVEIPARIFSFLVCALLGGLFLWALSALKRHRRKRRNG